MVPKNKQVRHVNKILNVDVKARIWSNIRLRSINIPLIMMIYGDVQGKLVNVWNRSANGYGAKFLFEIVCY